MLDLYEEFLRLVEGLVQRSINYALCGGLAVAVHGSPRAYNRYRFVEGREFPSARQNR